MISEALWLPYNPRKRYSSFKEPPVDTTKVHMLDLMNHFLLLFHCILPILTCFFFRLVGWTKDIYEVTVGFLVFFPIVLLRIILNIKQTEKPDTKR